MSEWSIPRASALTVGITETSLCRIYHPQMGHPWLIHMVVEGYGVGKKSKHQNISSCHISVGFMVANDHETKQDTRPNSRGEKRFHLFMG